MQGLLQIRTSAYCIVLVSLCARASVCVRCTRSIGFHRATWEIHFARSCRHVNRYLPKAHTCFFSLSLPKYSSQEVLAEKLEYAMDNCIEMDADFRLAEHEMTGWDQADVSAEQLF